MELKDFISNTIEQISLGVIEASRNCKEYNVIVNPSVTIGKSGDYFIPEKPQNVHITRRVQMINMDIVVSQIESEEAELNGKLWVSFLSLGGKTKEDKNIGSENRVRFSIPVALPIDNDCIVAKKINSRIL